MPPISLSFLRASAFSPPTLANIRVRVSVSCRSRPLRSILFRRPCNLLTCTFQPTSSRFLPHLLSCSLFFIFPLDLHPSIQIDQAFQQRVERDDQARDMTSTTMRRPPMRMMEPSSQDENTMPTASCSTQTSTASPSRNGTASHVRSPSKLPTLSDIAARLNRDRADSTPGSSPMKQSLSNGNDGRPRLELTGRISASPKLTQQGDRKSPLMPTSPTKADEQTSLTCPSPKAPSSGSCSPTKRMLAKGLPSFEEIRDRMSRKSLCPSNSDSKATPSNDTSPLIQHTPASPTKSEIDSTAKRSRRSKNRCHSHQHQHRL